MDLAPTRVDPATARAVSPTMVDGAAGPTAAARLWRRAHAAAKRMAPPGAAATRGHDSEGL